MSDLDIESLLAPLPGDSPCGGNLEYDPGFQALQEAAAGKPERQYGATVIAAEPPDWAAVREQALVLATRTRDLRLAVWLIRSAAHTDGLVGAVKGLQLLRGLLERYWDHVHPVLDPGDGNDPTARLNALAALHHEVGLADLRSAGLTSARGAVTVRDIELAFGRAEALPAEPVPTEAGLTPAVAAAQAQSRELTASMTSGLDHVQAIATLLVARLGAAQAPDLSPLVKLLRCVAQAARRVQGETPVEANESASITGSGVRSAAAGHAGSVQSREDAIRMLQQVCEWIERNEPSSPAPLLIQRAQRLMTKNFMEIIRDLVPQGLGQIETLAGPGRESAL